MKLRAFLAALSIACAAVVGGSAAPPFAVGAIYPTAGSHGRGGIDEYRGVSLAAELVNRDRGIGGARVRLVPAPADSSDQVPGAVDRLIAERVPVILGSYGSTISRPAAELAQQNDTVFWETGAVGELGMAASEGDRVFRFPPTGETLGRSAVTFARDRLLPSLRQPVRDLRYAVTYVDDVYGRAVGLGALAEIRRSRLTLAGTFPYTLQGADYAGLVASIKAARADVLFVSAYLDDGVALRRETVRQGLPLVASVGTSSSYCMHEFGAALGPDAVGLFASDKPDGHVLDASRLAPEAAEALTWARTEFERRFGHEMTAPALTGFAGAWALFHHVLPKAAARTPEAIALAARAASVPVGGLPNGSGLAFATKGTENLRATSVIWEWIRPGERAVVWPPAFATSPLVPLVP